MRDAPLLYGVLLLQSRSTEIYFDILLILETPFLRYDIHDVEK